MNGARLPVAIPDEVAAVASDLPAGLLGDSFRDACQRLDRYVGCLTAELAARLEIPEGSEIVLDELMAARPWAPAGRLAALWLLETLATYGWASSTGSGFMVGELPRSGASAAVRDEAVRAIPAAAPAYRVFELCAAALPGFLRGETKGEDALFSPATLDLWFEYFSNDNPHYSINNALAATALVRTLSPGARVLEVGGGGGSAAQAALAALAAAGKPPASYRFTELVPAFLRRGARVVQAAAPPGCTVTAARYDINRDPEEQGLAPAEFDAVLAVNTLHLAADVVGALARLRALLRPGGVVVLGELVRPRPSAGVHIELPFTFLEAYRSVPPVDGIRSRPGFLALAGWRAALQAAGFSRVAWLPGQLERCVALYSGFYCAAITAGR